MERSNYSFLNHKFSLFLIIATTVLFLSPVYAESGDEKTIALIDGSEITAEDFISYLDARPIAGGKGTLKDAVELRLDEMITAEVLYREAVRLKLDREPEIRQAIRQLLAQKLLNDQVNRPVWERKITEDELKKYYDDHINEFVQPEQVRLADIFIAVSEDAAPEVRDEKRSRAEEALAAALVSKGRFGFAEVAAKYSDKPANYSLGDTGFFDSEGSPIELEKEMTDAAFKLSKNREIYDKVIETASGYHVIMLVGKRSAVKRELKDLERQLEQRIRREEHARKRDEYIKTLRGHAEVRIEEQAIDEIIVQIENSVGRRASDRQSGRQVPPGLPGGNKIKSE